MLCSKFPVHGARALLRQSNSASRSISTIPRIVTPSFWRSLIPKPLRNYEPTTSTAQPKALKERTPWNPATFFIIIFLLIGSNSMNLITVKKDYISFSRQADAKIAALKDAIGRVQKGEDVDVKKLLGTGDPKAEQEWEDVLKELEQEKRLENAKAARRATRRAERKIEINKILQEEDDEEWKTNGKNDSKTAFY